MILTLEERFEIQSRQYADLRDELNSERDNVSRLRCDAVQYEEVIADYRKENFELRRHLAAAQSDNRRVHAELERVNAKIKAVDELLDF